MTKKVLSVTVDEQVLTEWKDYTQEGCINASQLIEKMLREYLQEHLKKGGKK
ncbi:MAG: hypothetical protein WCK90_03195 [archaeon]